jgi:hypothetical protein
LDKPHEHATPDQDAGNKWQAASYHDSQPTYLTVLSQLGAQASGYQEAQHTNPRGYRENERADRDLRAQEEMADWAFWVMALTGATVAVTFAGVLLVGFTLLETKRLRGEAEKTTRAAMAAVTSSDRAADATINAANAAIEANRLNKSAFITDQRAWISLENIAIGSPMVWENHEGKIALQFRYRNVGKTPAVQADLRAEIVVDSKRDPYGVFREFKLRMKDKEPFLGTTLFPNQEHRQLVRMTIEVDQLAKFFGEVGIDGWKEACPVMPVLVGAIQYRLSFDNDIHTTEFMYVIVKKAERGTLCMAPLDGNVPADQLVLQKWPDRYVNIT